MVCPWPHNWRQIEGQGLIPVLSVFESHAISSTVKERKGRGAEEGRERSEGKQSSGRKNRRGEGVLSTHSLPMMPQVGGEGLRGAFVLA